MADFAPGNPLEEVLLFYADSVFEMYSTLEKVVFCVTRNADINPDDEPSPARIAAIHDEAKAHDVTTIFFETLTSDALAKSIAGDLDLKTAVLDPLEGVTPNSPGQDYPSIMRANLEALRGANGCA